MADTPKKIASASTAPVSGATPKPAAKADHQPAKAGPKPKPGAAGKTKQDKQLHPLHLYTGTVGDFEFNLDGVYDRFALETTDGPTRTVKFPPHFGEVLRTLAQPGHAVAVLGFVHTTPKGDEHLHLAQVEAGGTTARPLAPGPAEAVTLAGTIAELRHDPRGHLHGLRLTGEENSELRLRLPPHLGQQLAERLVVGAALAASGRRRALRPGEVAAHPAPVQLELLTLGSDAFLVR